MLFGQIKLFGLGEKLGNMLIFTRILHLRLRILTFGLKQPTKLLNLKQKRQSDNQHAVEQINGREGETATLLSNIFGEL